MSGGPNPEALLQMMDDPNFLQQMNEAMNNPMVIEMMQQNPMVRNNPMIAEMLRNPEMRRMMFSPEMMRMQLQMQRSMNQNGGGSSFPMPGATNTTPQNSTGTPNQSNNAPQGQPGVDPFASLLGGAGAGGANPFASMFPGGANPFTPQHNQSASSPSTGPDTTASANTGATSTSDGTQNTSTSSPPPANPFASLFGSQPAGSQQSNPLADSMRAMMQNPEAMRAAMQMMGAVNGSDQNANPFAAFGTPAANPSDPTGASSPPPNPFAALFGPGSAFGGSPPPQDNRPPEEVYEVQLRQLNEMGFYEFDRNVMALRRSGGNVQAAIEFLLGGS